MIIKNIYGHEDAMIAELDFKRLDDPCSFFARLFRHHNTVIQKIERILSEVERENLEDYRHFCDSISKEESESIYLLHGETASLLNRRRTHLSPFIIRYDNQTNDFSIKCYLNEVYTFSNLYDDIVYKIRTV